MARGRAPQRDSMEQLQCGRLSLLKVDSTGQCGHSSRTLSYSVHCWASTGPQCTVRTCTVCAVALFAANFSYAAEYQCACTSVHNGPRLGSLMPPPTPAGPWGTVAANPNPPGAVSSPPRAPGTAYSRGPDMRARWRLTSGGCAAALRAARGCQRVARTPPVLPDAAARSAAAGTRAQRPAAAAAARPAAVVAAPAGSGSGLAAALRRPEHLRDAASEVAQVRRGHAARLGYRGASHGSVHED